MVGTWSCWIRAAESAVAWRRGGSARAGSIMAPSFLPFGTRAFRPRWAIGLPRAGRNPGSRRVGTHASAGRRVWHGGSAWHALTTSGDEIGADALLLTPPAPRTLVLLSGIPELLRLEFVKKLRRIDFDRAVRC